MDAVKIGKKLRELRGTRHQTTVAKAIGVTTTAISNYELGLRIPTDEVKIRLAKYFKTTVQKLFFSP